MTQLGSLISRMMSRRGMGKTYNGWRVVSQWEEIVGKDLARIAPAVKFCEGALFVKTSDPANRNYISMETELILKKIHEFPGGDAVKEIRFTRFGQSS